MRTPAQRALIFGVSISASCLLLHWLRVGLPMLALLAAVFALVALVALVAPRLRVRWFDHGVFLARASHWRRENGRHQSFDSIPLDVQDEGALHLRVDGIVVHLFSMPDRMQPRVIRLRRYLERELLFPAAERRRRG